MPYNHVVIVGGGPVGLLCAIEAKRQGFQSVTIIEKRGEYTRHNVPQIGEPLLKHLKKINLGLNDTEKMPIERNALGGASFREIEPVLLNKARDGGATVYRPYLINSLRGGSEKQNGRFKEVVLTIQECDAKGKAVVANAKPLQIRANLLIIATGGGAAEDPIVTQTLGFQYERLKPENYMALAFSSSTTTMTLISRRTWRPPPIKSLG
jgi:flavin-dependent dehydrogenase